MPKANSQSENSETRFEFEDDKTPRLDVTKSSRWWGWHQLDTKPNLKLSTSQQLDRYLVSRLPNSGNMLLFLIIWMVFITFLISGTLFQIRALTPLYTQIHYTEGGTYTEGLVGRPSNFNPIYATTQPDQAVSELVFASLFEYDFQNKLVPILAQSITADNKTQQYTLTLKKDLKWHDGQPITADDLIFTIETIQNPEAQSPLRDNWQGVGVDKIDDYTVNFTLEASFSPFATNLTLSIIPKHLLEQEDIKQLRRSSFNYQPVGSGAFQFNHLTHVNTSAGDEFKIQLSRNPIWSASPSQPLVDYFQFWLVPSADRVTELFNQGQLSGSPDLIANQIDLVELEDYQTVDLRLMTGVYLFFKNSDSVLKNRTIRQVLTHALDIESLVKDLEGRQQIISGPLLPEHKGYQAKDDTIHFKPQLASQLLVEAGYSKINGYWQRDGRILSLTLTTQRETDYETVAQGIVKQLDQFGIEVKLDLRHADQIPFEIFQNHNYGSMLLFGLNLGRDADVYSYWHSSQIDSDSILRLNLAQYRSSEADEALEAGRSRLDPSLRQDRYEDFQTTWASDFPSLPLYRPNFRYYTFGDVRGPDRSLLLEKSINRFFDVNNWAVKTKRQIIQTD
ncbi:MAG: peptide ABC transporter substrate-binding protein [Candidatus Saccharibacteria bacterium]|nr:peptide ABC transporter substrate-binding protein [Candidatus Saccharibacteria bacterium]